MLIINPAIENKFLREKNFKLFKHSDLLCCVVRMSHNGCLCGYVGVSETNELFGKNYDYKIKANLDEIQFNGNYLGLLSSALDPDRKEDEAPLYMAIQVHCGLTYSEPHLIYIDENVSGKLWWFGFDTAHSGDMRVFVDANRDNFDDTYRDFEFVENETKQLAEQLAKFNNVTCAGISD